ncbi:alkaline phosphatase family protein [Novosphingobium sp. G106]|uniref:alkaline phosphatase family protein n=1 Tax=Novosphingobium sp. G106 TaxID=2849500 RepID=UPI001C2CEEB9|nr:alkaline phosphatase family protein [Novosphingobium sp. G106]MBV1690716.1 alkaline phosphatase family protein [Novosphingobium sp. G106]
MRRSFASLALAAAIAVSGTAGAKPARKPAPAPVALSPTAPKLIVAISVDQFSADLFAQYRRLYTAGLARLQQGAVFPSGFQSHAATETCPGHSTLMTGDRPARTGIIANMWFDPANPRAEKRIYCAEDERDPASTPDDPVVSAWHLKVPTLGERLKAVSPASRNVAVSAKDRAVMMMGGHDIDAAYWWRRGAFVTLNGRKISPAVEAVNGLAADMIKAGDAPMALPEWCAPRDRAVAAGSKTVGTGRFPLEAGKEAGFRTSPRIDAATGALAARLVDEMKLGQGKAPDVLSVSFSATDYVGHTFGTEGAEMCIQMAELDKTIGSLLDHLDAKGIDYVVVLSADHGGFDLPERLTQQALPGAVRVGSGLGPDELAAAVTAKSGVTAPGRLLYSDGPFGDFYFSAALSAEDKAKAQAALVEIARAHPQVAAAYTKADLAAVPMPGGSPQDFTLIQRARASFDPQRSGDVVILLNRGVVPIPDPSRGAVATHGSPWDYDRRVPMLFWRKGLAGEEQPAPVETVDIAPTLAAMLGLVVPQGEFDGRCLDIDGGAGDTCAPKR